MTQHTKKALDKWAFRAVWGVLIVTSILFAIKLVGLVGVHTL